jgi:hypothetical protein
MNASKTEAPAERITFSLLCARCGERVDREVSDERIPEFLRCDCGNYVSLTGQAEWPLRHESAPEADPEPVPL